MYAQRQASRKATTFNLSFSNTLVNTITLMNGRFFVGDENGLVKSVRFSVNDKSEASAEPAVVAIRAQPSKAKNVVKLATYPGPLTPMVCQLWHPSLEL